MRRRCLCLIIGAMAVICALLCSGIVHAPFILDDNSFIVNASHIHIKNLSFSALKAAAVEGIPAHRPIPKISFALNYYFGRLDPAGYHLVNIAIHVLVSFFVYLLFAQVLFLASGRRDGDQNRNRMIALAAAMIWMVHPLHTESVTYVCQRMTSMSALFFISSLLCYGEARLRQQNGGSGKAVAVFFVFAGIFGIAAFLSKENAATLPLFILLYERLFFINEKNRAFFKAAVLVSLSVFFAAAFFYLGPHPVARIARSYTNRMFDLSQRLLTEARIVIYYICLIFFPHPSRLNLDYSYPVSTSVMHPPTTALAILAICALVLLGLYAARKDRILCLAIFWFFGNLVIESSFVGLELVFEHRTYLPSMFLILWLAKASAGKIKSRRVRISALCAVFLVFSVFTYQRNKVWASPVTLWADCVKKSPFKVRPNFNLGCFLEKSGEYKAALGFFEVAKRINPGFDQTHYHIGCCLGRLGEYQRAEKAFKIAIALNPKNSDAHNNLGNVFAETGRLVSAVVEYKKAIVLSPGDASIRINLAGVLADTGKPDEAISQYQKALSYAPDNVGALNDLGYLLFRRGRLDEARAYLESALAIDSDNAGARARLGDLFLQKGDIAAAIDQYKRVLRIAPDDARTLYNLGIALYRMGRASDACAYFKQATRLDGTLGLPPRISAVCKR